MKAFIYVLKDPLTGEVRYVGATRDTAARFNGHLDECKKRSGIKHVWMNGLIAQGLRPILEILDEVEIEESPMWEAAYIDFFKGNGCDLLNTNRGAPRPMFHSEETKKKIGAAHIGNKYGLGIKRTMTSEWRAKIAEAAKKRRGKGFSPEHIAKLSASRMGAKNHNFGKTFSAEVRAKMGAPRKGKPWTEARRAAQKKRIPT